MKHKILIVDDEDSVTQALSRLLGRRYDVTVAANGEEALAAIDRAGPFTLVISDHHMPGMDGIELLARLRCSEGCFSRIMLTGDIDSRLTIESINRAGVSRFLTKPVAAPDLIAHVEASLQEVEASFAGAAIAPRLTVLQAELLSGLHFERALYPVFQPKVDLRNGRIIGVEALSRLRPEFGSLSPTQFCGFYENSRRAAEFSGWILDASLASAAHWAALGWPLQMAVNMPPHLLRSRRFAAMVHAALDRHGLPGEALQIEITERGAADLDDELKCIVAELLARGVSLAVDDFGAGYDSLLTLKELGISVLKLDGWMIRDLSASARAQHILQSILEMAARLQVRVVAEGVETAEQADRLRALGCDAAQGYLFGRPMQEAELLSWLQTPCPTFSL